jgi:hypothetical protein
VRKSSRYEARLLLVSTRMLRKSSKQPVRDREKALNFMNQNAYCGTTIRPNMYIDVNVCNPHSIIQVNGKISNFGVECGAGTRVELAGSGLLVHTVCAAHGDSQPK